MRLAALAAVLAGIAVWEAWTPDCRSRLVPLQPVKLPSWAAARPGSLSSRTRWLIAAGLGIFAATYGWSFSAWAIVLAPIVACGAWLGLGRLESGAVGRARMLARALIPEVLDVMRMCVKAGQPLRLATKTAADVFPSVVSSPLRKVMNGIAVGLSDAQAWLILSDDDVWKSIASDLSLASANGLSVDRILRRHSESMRRISQVQRLTRVKSLGVKSVLPLGMCYLPAFALLGVVPIIVSGITHLF